MRDLGPSLERRQSMRRQPKVACELFLGAGRHEATILDASRGGLFLATEAPLRPSALVRVRLKGAERFAVVVHERNIPALLRALLPSGVGLRWLRSSPAG